MDAYEALLSRRTIHDYKTDPLPDGLLERALEAALRAPNHKLTNPWRFTRVGPRTRQAIVDLGVRLKREKGHVSADQEAKLRAKYGSSPELLVVSQVLDEDPARRKEDYAAIACALENLMVALWADGVGSKWSTGALTTHAETYGLCNIDPEDEQIVGFIWIGYPERVPDPPREPLSSVYRQTA